MKATEAQIEECLPVWEALSEFFLDTELQPEDHHRIARTLAATRFTEKEIEDILICEVCPVAGGMHFVGSGSVSIQTGLKPN